MTKITEFNRNNLKELRSDIDNALNAVLAKHGLSGGIGNIRFSSDDFRAQLTVATGSTDDAAEREFKKYAFKFGLSDDKFGTTFTRNGKKFTVSGINPKAKRGGYPVLAKNAKGTTFKFPASVVA